MNKSIIIIAIVLHILSSCYVFKMSKNHYKNSTKLWDFFHQYTTDRHIMEFMTNIMLLIPLAVAFYTHTQYKLFDDLLTYFPIIIIIRSIITFATILPPQEHCKNEKFTIGSLINGHCFDKIFSGHFALFFLMTLILHRYKAIGLITLTLLNVFYAGIVLLTRAHYTTDIIIAFFMVLSVYNNCFAF